MSRALDHARGRRQGLEAWLVSLDNAAKPVYSTSMYVLDERQKHRTAVLDAIDAARKEAELNLADALVKEAALLAAQLREKHAPKEPS